MKRTHSNEIISPNNGNKNLQDGFDFLVEILCVYAQPALIRVKRATGTGWCVLLSDAKFVNLVKGAKFTSKKEI